MDRERNRAWLQRPPLTPASRGPFPPTCLPNENSVTAEVAGPSPVAPPYIPFRAESLRIRTGTSLEQDRWSISFYTADPLAWSCSLPAEWILREALSDRVSPDKR